MVDARCGLQSPNPRRHAVVLGGIVDADEPIGRTRAGDASERVARQAAVASLAPDRREAFVLTQIVGLGYAEAAEVCACPVGTIRSRVARARADLVAALEVPGSGAASDSAR